MPEWDKIFAFTTAGTAIVAIVISVLQMKQNNKQHLFDRRLATWERVSGLLELFRDNRQQLLHNEGNKPESAVDLEFKWFTNNTFLEQIQTAISNPLDSQEQRKLHLKLDEIKLTASEFKFLFKQKRYTTFSHFISLYRDLLYEMYQYKILFDHMTDYTEKYHSSLEKTQDVFHERDRYTRVYLSKCVTGVFHYWFLLSGQRSAKGESECVQCGFPSCGPSYLASAGRVE